jgi:hypothetical protein
MLGAAILIDALQRSAKELTIPFVFLMLICLLGAAVIHTLEIVSGTDIEDNAGVYSSARAHTCPAPRTGVA